MTHLRILTYNIHKGFTVGNRRFVLEGIRSAIREVHADLVFLQEVHGARTGELQPQFEFLADELWPHTAYGRNAVYTSGHHGNAILSKFPILSWENIDVSTSRLERRGLLHCTLELPKMSQSIHAVCCHLGLFEADRGQQIGRLCQRIDRSVPHHEPVIIAGDFNDWREKTSSTLFEKLGIREAFEVLHGNCARTFPNWLPTLRLDRIYYRGLIPKTARRLDSAPWRALSDHIPLYSELELGDGLKAESTE